MSTKVTNTIAQTVLPSWYTNYAQQILSNQSALSSQPYQAYQGPRVASFTPTQQQGFDMTKQAATSYQPSLTNAQNTLSNALGRSGAAVAQPYFQQANAISPTAAAAQNLGLAGALGAAGTGISGLSMAAPYLQTAGSMSGVSAALPGLQQGANYTDSGAQGLGIAMASPYMQAAGQSTADITNQYMSPYLDTVVNRIGELGVRTLNEQVLPGISDTMIGAGQYGGTRQAELMGRAVRDAMSEISAQQAAALNQGYTQAQGIAQGDLSRYGALASTAGSLGNQQQQALLQAGQNYASLGSTLGNLTQGQQSALAGIGSTLGNLAGQEQQGLYQGANLFSTLGGQQAALSEADRNFLAQQGSTLAGLYNQDTANQFSGASALAQLAAQQQQQALAGASAVTGVGNQQQQLKQANLDAAYQEYLAQQKYAQDQINNQVATMQGVAGAVPNATAQVQSSKVPSASTLSQLGSIASSALGIGSMLGLGGTGTTTAAK